MILDQADELQLEGSGPRVSGGDLYHIDCNRDYIQVCQTIVDDNTKERELRPFRKVLGEGRRLLITGDPTPKVETEEAVIVNILDFLME